MSGDHAKIAKMLTKECAFCCDSEVKSRTIIENKLARAFTAQQAIVPGHVLIVPIRHIASFRELTQSERDSIFNLQGQIEDALKQVFEAEGFNIAYNQEKMVGQSIPHFHLHVVPRKEGDTGITEYEPRQFLYRPGPRLASSESELQQIAKIIRDAL